MERPPPWQRPRPPSSSCGQTNISENITFPQLRLRAVKILISTLDMVNALWWTLLRESLTIRFFVHVLLWLLSNVHAKHNNFRGHRWHFIAEAILVHSIHMRRKRVLPIGFSITRVYIFAIWTNNLHRIKTWRYNALNWGQAYVFSVFRSSLVIFSTDLIWRWFQYAG